MTRWFIPIASLIIALTVVVAVAQDRTFTLTVTEADLAILDQVFAEAPVARKLTQPLIDKLAKQITEQRK